MIALSSRESFALKLATDSNPLYVSDLTFAESISMARGVQRQCPDVRPGLRQPRAPRPHEWDTDMKKFIAALLLHRRSTGLLVATLLLALAFGGSAL
jgi:hypothetical protein